MAQRSFLVSNTASPGDYALVSNVSRSVTHFTVSINKDIPEKVACTTNSVASLESGITNVVSAAICCRKDTQAVAIGDDNGKLSFPLSSAQEPSTTHLGGGPCTAVAWNPVYHHLLAVSTGDEQLALLDVAQVTNGGHKSEDYHVAAIAEPDICIKLHNQRVVGGVSAMEWMPCLPHSLIVASPTKYTPLLVDPRSGNVTNFGTDSVEGKEPRRRDNTPLAAVAAHPSLPYVATVANERKKAVVHLWDVRTMGRPMHRRTLERESFSYIQWYPSGSDLTLAALLRDEPWVRVMSFTPNNTSDFAADDGYHSSFISAATSATDANSDAYHSWRATDRMKIRNTSVFQQFCWLNVSRESPRANNTNESSVVTSGVGTADAILGVAPNGEMNVVTLKSSPLFSWASPTKVISAFEGSLMKVSPIENLADKYRNDVAFRVKQRLREGFGLDPVVNIDVARCFNDRPLQDLFRYVDVIKNLNLAPPNAFPGIIELVRDTSLPERHCSKQKGFVSTLSTSRQVLLEVMGWTGSHSQIDDIVQLATDDFERRVAISIFLGQFNEAVELLLLRSEATPSYAPLAALLQGIRHNEPVSWTSLTTESICRSLNDWLSIAINFIATFWPHCALDERASVLYDPRMPVIDRIALGVARIQNVENLVRLCDGYEKKLMEDQVPTYFVLSGINATSSRAMQRYVDCTGDVQLAACLFSFVCVPKHIACPAWQEWNRAYRELLNEWGMFIERAEYDVSRKKLVPSDETDSRMKIGSAGPRHKLSIEVRCQCGQALHDTAPTKAATAFSLKAPSRLQCPNPSCKYPNGFPLCAVCGKKMEPRGSDIPIERWFVWCTKCLHGGHMEHISEWFKKHKKCPIEDCNCNCQTHDLQIQPVATDSDMLF